MRPAVFLDRDGTMIHDVGYLSRREDLHWFPWTIDAVRLLNRAGFLVFVTTNQGGIGLGYCTPEFVESTHRAMQATIEAAGGRIDGWYYCPHHPRAVTDVLRIACRCRKPQPGMIELACRRFEVDLQRSFVVGDKLADVELGGGVGATSILVRTGHGELEVARLGGRVAGAAHVAAELMEATSWILDRAGATAELR